MDVMVRNDDGKRLLSFATNRKDSSHQHVFQHAQGWNIAYTQWHQPR